MGLVAGAAVGLVPALFTFGLSIPAGTVIGGTIGGATGTTVGAATGFVAGGVSGNVAWAYRVEIRNNVVYVKAKVVEISAQVKSTVMDKRHKLQSAVFSCVNSVQKKASAKWNVVCTETRKAAQKSVGKASELKITVKKAASESSVQVAAASAVSGSVVLGTTGLATGATVGAAIGFVPALFTFGMSIPICAAIGGGIGATTGASAGFGVGGAVGYGVYTKRTEIKGTACSVKDYVKEKAKNVSGAVNSVKTRIRVPV